ncbi:DNA-binding transcriptional LysR family regulator [Neorhizobium huautlense]|uniref:DNA-binding transcriptional LysR family regulator n=1 Tax=Neorhizobium huautlense TaxID=67774 RepID=A0ABT9Q142_9HYPH|nr:LysR family transcriptional regulator [Neorhizobium huautlense]MDP9840397.1 DNA-binding transcriptional LysR family regulator [Neorhizobium huautlense]
MPRSLNLRQVEIFKAVIEQGTVSRAAESAFISQPAASKLLVQLESDHGLTLFDRHKGRLIPTAQALRLYEEIDRIFAGVRQVESAIAFIKREEQSRLFVGVIPALAGAFIQRATMQFLDQNPDVYCSIESLSSQWVAEYILNRKLDVGLVSSRVDNPYLVTEPVMEHNLICIMPPDHPLSGLDVIRPEHLDRTPLISFQPGSYTGQKIEKIFDSYSIDPNIVLTAAASPTVCEFVAGGLGISLVHPLFVAGMEGRIAVRPFEPGIPFDFLLCYLRDARSAHLISRFVKETKAVAARQIDEVKKGWGSLV